MKRSVTAKRFQRFNEIRLPLRSIVLAAFFLLGVMFGYAAAQRAKTVVGEELAAYLQRFAELAYEMKSFDGKMPQDQVDAFAASS